MNSSKLIVLSVIAATCGCSSSSPQPSSLADQNALTTSQIKPAARPQGSSSGGVLASVHGRPITAEMLQRPLLDAYGLQFVLHLVQLDLARQKAMDLGLSVTPDEVAAERRITIEEAFKGTIDPAKIKGTGEEKAEFLHKQYERLLDQFLASKRISKPELALAMETSANLRKVAQHEVKDKVSEEDLQKAFKITYGEKVRVKHIKVQSGIEVNECIRLIQDEKRSFEDVAREKSIDTDSRDLGGVIRPFSRAERMWPAAFVNAAFDLQTPGEISDPVNVGDATHLIKLEEKIPPKVVRYEDHKEALRGELLRLMAEFRVKQLRQELAAEAQRAIKIEDPEIRRQYHDLMAKSSGESPRDSGDLRRELEMNRPATRPAKTSDVIGQHERKQ